jgi:hypothetical protein
MEPGQLGEHETLIAALAELLDRLGPFHTGTPRSERWRTTEQLANELQTQVGSDTPLDVRVETALNRHEAEAFARLGAGHPAAARIRRAKYPDRTTVLPLWGSTKYHGQPWTDFPSAERTDKPDDLPQHLRLPPGSPAWFLSHTREDGRLARRVTEALAHVGVAGWMYESQIHERGNIARSVCEALKSSVGCLALTTRSSMASLWVLSELHTAKQQARPVRLLVDGEDRKLLALLASVRFPADCKPMDDRVGYDKDIVSEFRADYAARSTPSRAARYNEQVHDFLATLPLYLESGPVIVFPAVPSAPAGSVRMVGWDAFLPTATSGAADSASPCHVDAGPLDGW